MRDLTSAIRGSLRDLSPEYFQFRADSYEGEDGDLFVEVKSTQHNGNGYGMVNVSRQAALGCIEATDDETTVHLTCMFRHNVTRLTISPSLRELSEEAMKARMAHELRIS